MGAEALDVLTKIAKETSLRYAMHMIMTSSLVTKQRRGGEVEPGDIRRVFSLFSDLRRSTEYLMEFNRQFMFNEVDVDGDDAGAGGEGDGGEAGAALAAGAAGAGVVPAAVPAAAAGGAGAGAGAGAGSGGMAEDR